ncbi:MAG: radical SAM protein [Candidatus Bruticola sp.]
MNWKEIVKQVFLDGGPSTCQFAITNACNAKCEFCNFSRENALKQGQTKTIVKLSAGLNAIDCLYRNGVRFLIFTGGEPTLNPHLEQFMAHSRDLGMDCLIVTNGSTLSPDKVHSLIENGLHEVIISVDSADTSVSEKNRGLPGVTERITAANDIFKQHKVGRVASVTLSKILGPLSELPRTLERMGFEAVTFSFPLINLDSNYLGCKDSELVNYTPEEMHKLIDEVIDLKKSYRVLNPTASMMDMHRYLNKEPQNFVCLGGFKQFYLDWDLQLWRCCNWRRPMCHVCEFNGSQMIRDGCTECMIDCYRDASVMQHCAVSVADAVHAACCGRWDLSFRHIFNMNNLRSLGAVLENSHWLNNL